MSISWLSKAIGFAPGLYQTPNVQRPRNSKGPALYRPLPARRAALSLFGPLKTALRFVCLEAFGLEAFRAFRLIKHYQLPKGETNNAFSL
jgi:hypothetical protein